METPYLKYYDAIFAITSEMHLISDLFQENEKYSTLLISLKEWLSNNEELPYQKDLLKTLDLRRTELMDLMNELYRDFQKNICNEKAQL